MISKAALDAVTSPENLVESASGSIGVRAVRDRDVVAELRQLEGLGTSEARRLGREAIVHLGGYIEPDQRGARGFGSRRPRLRQTEVWWVPEVRIRTARAE